MFLRVLIHHANFEELVIREFERKKNPESQNGKVLPLSQRVHASCSQLPSGDLKNQFQGVTCSNVLWAFT